MNTTEITNHDVSEGAVLADVADMLQGAGDDRIKSRILNKVDWEAIGVDDIDTQIGGRRLIRARGYDGSFDARINVDGEALRDVRLDEITTVHFRRWLDDRGVWHFGALWAYLDTDLPEQVPVYVEDLDADAVGAEAAKYTLNRMYSDLCHVPIYDAHGIIVLADEDGTTGDDLFDAGVAMVDSDRVRVYKAQVISARAEFPTAEGAAEYQALLWDNLRYVDPSSRAARARKMYLPGDTPDGLGARVPVKPAAPAKRGPVVKEAPPAKRGLLARLGLGR